MKNMIGQFSRQQLELMITTDRAHCGDVAALARIALELQDAPGKIYQIRKLDGSEEWQEWQEWEEVSAAEYHANVSNEGWGRRILHTSTKASMPDGWKLVPIEPTEDMVVYGFESEPDKSFSDEQAWEAYEAMSGCGQAHHRARLCYAAMLAAAPAPGDDDA